MWKLIIEDEEKERMVVHLTRDQYTIGRREGNIIRLTERNVSRDHARLRACEPAEAIQDVAYCIDDLQSYNGVLINGRKIQRSQNLINGDLIQIGNYQIVIQNEGVSDTQEKEGAVTPQSATIREDKTPPISLPPRGRQLLDRPNRLVMLVGPTPGEEYPLTAEYIRIGRSEESEISINHNSVSRVHCEIHQLGGGRYEIVDKGSSNGVRVHGSELKRGIIEAGDVIELGDVRLKFIGAGQIFLANSSASQRLAAITDRTVSDLPVAPKKSSLLPYTLLGLFVGVFFAAGIWIVIGGSFGRKPPSERKTIPSSVAANDGEKNEVTPNEAEILKEALALCNSNRCDAGHLKLSEIAASSFARKTVEFAAIDSLWTQKLLTLAAEEKAPDLKVAIYNRIVTEAQLSESKQLGEAKMEELLSQAGVKDAQKP